MGTQWGQIFTCVCSRVVPLERKHTVWLTYLPLFFPERQREGKRLLSWNIKGLYSGMGANNASPGRRPLNLLEQYLISNFQDMAAIQSSFVSQWSLLRNPELCRNVKIFVENCLPADATWAKTRMLEVLYLMNRTYLNTDTNDPHGYYFTVE